MSRASGESVSSSVLEDVDAGPVPRSPTYSKAPRSPESTKVPGLPPTSAPSIKHSIKSTKSKAATTHTHEAHHHHLYHLTPTDKFRTVVRKIIAMHRSTSIISGGGAGAEPGINPRRHSANLLYGSIHQDCVIELFEYSSVRSSYGKMTNKEFVKFMADPKASATEPWVKVRWINVAGLSWDVVKALAIKYDLHPLAIEDIFHTRSQTRSKVDYFNRHLFLRVLVHELGAQDELITESAAFGSTLNDNGQDIPRSSSPLSFDEDDKKKMADLEGGTIATKENGGKPSIGSRTHSFPPAKQPTTKPRHHHHSYLSRIEENLPDARAKRKMEEVALEEIKNMDDRVNVNVYPIFIFLLRDGTVISIHTGRDNALTQPITGRLHQRDTMLRTSADPSLLVQSLLDLVVDKALEVVDEYHAMIKKFEREVLIKPSVKTIRNLHILSGDLTLHKRTLEPIKTIIYGLRRYDLDRCAAILDTTQNPDAKVVGYMSHKSKIYLADVYDHMDYILTSLEMFTGIGDGLVDYTFNMKSYEMNETMRLLTMVTIVFLPLTILTGYFGMNFKPMPAVDEHSDLLFWEIAIPVMAVVIPLATFGDLRKAYHYFKKKLVAKQAVKGYHQRIKAE